MAKKSFVSVGIEIPGAEIENISLKSKVSLLDFDVIVIDPSIHEFYGYDYDDYLGKRCLDDYHSFSLKEHIEHWRREILEAIRAGKNVFFMLNKEDVVYAATGTKSHSGTGRNRQTTRHVGTVSNYSIVPGEINVTNSNGSSMKLIGKENILTSYWAAIKEKSEYRVLLDGEGVKPIVQTRTGQKTVGAKIRYKNADGNLVLLPYVNFETDEFSYESDDDGKFYWTEEATSFGKRLIASICEVDKILKSSSELSAKPDWLSQDKYVLPKEEKVRSKLLEMESKIDDLQKQKERLEQNLADESILKRLLYEKGKPLEEAVHIALELIGFKVAHFNESD